MLQRRCGFASEKYVVRTAHLSPACQDANIVSSSDDTLIAYPPADRVTAHAPWGAV